jgi:NAD-dependent SIR2 family protein deacetylase
VAGLLKNADGLILTAGAGMGVDSGLPDFRGPEGFWGAYPALGRARIHFEEIANPRAFHEDPRLAWGFYGHRLNLYRRTDPHAGFALLHRLAGRFPHGIFIFTSNVDGQFQKAGFSEEGIVECHGSIHFLQCLEGCREALWSAGNFNPVVDEESCRLLSGLPRCPHCGGLARPNILMFGDGGWIHHRTLEQEKHFGIWRRMVDRPVVIEVGAGTDIPTVRLFGEGQGRPLIRINPREWLTTRPGDVGICLGAHLGFMALTEALGGG